jgi:hypothetical protein
MTAQGVDLALPTIAANGKHIGLAEPFLVKQHFRRDAQSVLRWHFFAHAVDAHLNRSAGPKPANLFKSLLISFRQANCYLDLSNRPDGKDFGREKRANERQYGVIVSKPDLFLPPRLPTFVGHSEAGE